MKIAVLKEQRPYEARVALTPEVAKKLKDQGHEVWVEKEAGAASSIPDTAYTEVGATIFTTLKEGLGGAQVLLKVQAPLSESSRNELEGLPEGATVIGLLSPHTYRSEMAQYNAKKLKTFSLEMVPRITRAQSMDVLSSQSNLAGYRAVIEGASLFDRAFPMMMTAAGTIAPARVLVLGAGVAGLQAIATAKRLGAIVSAFDVRAAAKEQVESLGATFISVDAPTSGEGAGGYAKEMDDDYKKRQAEKITETLKSQDIVITTALIPGRPAPLLVTEEMLSVMKAGSVIVDMAVESGGNCASSKLGEVITTPRGVKIVGYANLPSRISRDASALYARNVMHFLTLLMSKDGKDLAPDPEDEIVKATLLTQEGATVHPHFQEK
ncbi:MAG: Re/Si-specific NAD(P)(+) transhydrogenase subunit alpha [Alphaproteobacteria bacterium]|nr:Re/Si-specific NAD(P)(+) transhydrogenase subunit alpha [Alphaproteobacteria bacterium]